MDYIEIEVCVSPRQPGADLLVSELADAGFESFVDTNEGFMAYIPKADFSDDLLTVFQSLNTDIGQVSYTQKLIPSQNWNASWESSYQPIQIGERLCIRAPFHQAAANVEIDLVIQPQQSFGTGHHATTRLMAQKLLTLPLSARYILDMGCGTGVLAILASSLGASNVLGIDIEEHAVENARENAARNQQTELQFETGTETNIGERTFDCILANINKNVLIQAMPIYVNALRDKGELLLSGFFITDTEDISRVVTKLGLKPHSILNEGDWALLHFTKTV
jgi:ribosomal protein L11 methyltransferase